MDSSQPPLQHEAKCETRDGAVRAKEERLQHLNHDFSKEEMKRVICATVMAKEKEEITVTKKKERNLHVNAKSGDILGLRSVLQLQSRQMFVGIACTTFF